MTSLLLSTSPSESSIEQAYSAANEQYASFGVDVDKVIQSLRRVPISIQCWQGDDVGGFERGSKDPGGGLAVTGTCPGKARTPDELRADFEQALALIPGKHRINLHASYSETGSRTVERNELEVTHFSGWIDWAKRLGLGIDFNPTYFGHPRADDGFTLSHPDREVRKFWIEHGIACRRIGAAIGKSLGTPCVTNVWIPDGSKDNPVDRSGPRHRLAEALDDIFSEHLDPDFNLDSVESKLFGIGSESYVVGSFEFYLGYAISRNKLLCLDSGHFHPTEQVSDKISSVLMYLDRLLLHVSRGIRWDSDHVVTLSDETKAIAEELVRGGFLERTHIGLDYFDASINRVAAWVIGARALLKALLIALLEPLDNLRQLEAQGDYTARLAVLEELKTLPVGAVWDYYCLVNEKPVSSAWLAEIARYEKDVLCKRN